MRGFEGLTVNKWKILKEKCGMFRVGVNKGGFMKENEEFRRVGIIK